ncbi:MAG: TRAM domain-containing protein, partial [Coriobacteriales bacterium]|nr:TRAM domain-containing protein [Coriobacteriales bacterium]
MASTQRLTIERMTYGPDAIAHAADGKTVFVSGAVAGDVVEARIVQDGPSFSKAVAQEILEPSPSRTQPACPYAAVCGGCPWASLDYEAQREAKRANLCDSLTRIGHMPKEQVDALVQPCESPSSPWGYRNKVELAFARQGKRVVCGMHGTAADGTASVVRVDSCPLLDSKHAKLVKSVSGALNYLAGS